jgi:branched-chain amino acid aminotransferase
MFKDGVLYTPFATACLPGISRGMAIIVARKNGMEVKEADLSLTDFYNADFVFATGTMGELTPITEIDGRVIERERGEAIFDALLAYYQKAIPAYCEKL